MLSGLSWPGLAVRVVPEGQGGLAPDRSPGLPGKTLIIVTLPRRSRPENTCREAVGAGWRECFPPLAGNLTSEARPMGGFERFFALCWKNGNALVYSIGHFLMHHAIAISRLIQKRRLGF